MVKKQKKKKKTEKVLPQATKLSETSGFFKKNNFLEEKKLPQAAKLPRTSGLFKKNDFGGKQSAPGSAAAPDKWLDREKANNHCSQGRGAPFGGPGGRSPLEKQGGAGDVMFGVDAGIMSKKT